MEIWQKVILVAYGIIVALLSMFGYHRYLLLRLFYKHRKRPAQPAAPFDDLPKVTIQLPIYNEFHVIDEVFLPNSDTYRLCDNLLQRGYRGVHIIPDSTAKNRKTSGRSDIQILKESGFTVIPTLNRYQRDRVNNVNRLLTADRIKINPKCKKLINDLERVSWKNDKLDQTGGNKELTHVSDAMGYGLWKLDKIEDKTKKIITLR